MPRCSSAKIWIPFETLSNNWSIFYTCNYSYPVLTEFVLVQVLSLKSVLTSFNQLAFSSCFIILLHLISSAVLLLKFPFSFVFTATVPSCFPPALDCVFFTLTASLASLTAYIQLSPRILVLRVSLPQQFQPFPSTVTFASLLLDVFISNTHLLSSKSSSFLPTVNASSLLYFY